MNLPDAVRAYFDADQSADAKALIGAFSETAVVRDEGATYEGLEPIRLWWLEAKRKYSHRAEPISVTGDGNGISVLATVSGNFPNSPAQLGFRFVLEKGTISELEIG
ncbi:MULTISPECIES: nuclear transport factor 2 family protein [unclassified Sinorhizobium]|uniref:nuclear transport factor 2 family protein n=1 Tax=unclassified Sinorhizobium TaxID=2613772 RepID=UPI0024C37A00|nr:MULTISPECIES: nuclear transport factor 2 family protein [unclassified Sinorhizobium]MDK1374756.1 nuclear transport factor 2 family protein [Sinorhizobium sp. 6-70]MDK1479061.1 nuclear transport factor 2 family protein [Sinorhizobium sp. 6-117]